MPKNEAQEVENVEKVESSEKTEQTEQEAEKGFFAKAVDKAKEATNELFGNSDEAQEASQEKPTQTPKLKSILKKSVKFTSVTAFIYKGEGSFTLKIGAYPYIIESGEVFIVPDDKTAQYLRYKEQLFSEITR